MLDKYNTATNVSLMRQHMGYGHIYDLNKLTQKVLLNTQYLGSMNPTAGSFVINPRLQRLFATFAVGFPSAESLNTIYSTFLLGHLKSFSSEVIEQGKKVVQAALMLHKRVAGQVSVDDTHAHTHTHTHTHAHTHTACPTHKHTHTHTVSAMPRWWWRGARRFGDTSPRIHTQHTYTTYVAHSCGQPFPLLEYSPSPFPFLFAVPQDGV
jgi:hypothetical protein